MKAIDKIFFALSLAISKVKYRYFPKKRIYLIGDSLIAPQPWYKYPRSGWGEQLSTHLKTDKVKVINKARNGASTKSFYDDKYFANVLNSIVKEDIVFIGFGHNDKGNDETALVVFRDYLSLFIKDLKSKNAFIVLGTPINFYGLSPDHGDFPDTIRSLAHEHNLVLIDLTAYSEKLHQQLDMQAFKDLYLIAEPDQFINFPNGIQDFIHLSPYGAQQFSKYVANVINKII